MSFISISLCGKKPDRRASRERRRVLRDATFLNTERRSAIARESCNPSEVQNQVSILHFWGTEWEIPDAIGIVEECGLEIVTPCHAVAAAVL
jgi:hypothetical protein